MSFKFNKDLKLILHPYAFILKEGDKFNKNLLDYQLLMLQVSCPETIKSPPHVRQAELMRTKLMNLIKNPPPPQPKEKNIDNIAIS